METDQTKFNAGVDAALELSTYVKMSARYSMYADYSNWYLVLESIERRISPKMRSNDDATKEISNIHKTYNDDFRKYLLRVSKKRKIPRGMHDSVKQYLSQYEKSLLFWLDKFGYRMPTKDDPANAAWR